MKPVNVQTLIVSAAPAPSILVLQPIEEPSQPGKYRIVPIWVGMNEATQLGIALEKARLARPMTHDLFLDALTNLDARVEVRERIEEQVVRHGPCQAGFLQGYPQLGGLVHANPDGNDAVLSGLRRLFDGLQHENGGSRRGRHDQGLHVDGFHRSSSLARVRRYVDRPRLYRALAISTVDEEGVFLA